MESDSPMEHIDSNDQGYGYNEDTSDANTVDIGTVMSPQTQQERRNSIREIMADESLTPLEKRRNIQSLMDGRRRSSLASQVSTASTCTMGEMAGSAVEGTDYIFQTDDNYSQHSHMSNSNHSSHSSQQQHYNYNVDTNSASYTAMNDREYYGYREYDKQQLEQLLQSGGTGTSPGGGGDGREANEELLLHSIDSLSAAGRKQRSSSMPLWSEDTSRAAAPLVAARSNTIWEDPINISRRMEKSRPPCPHYERNCTIISPCCGLAFGCRICHDDCPVLPMPFAKRPLPPPPPPPLPALVVTPDDGGIAQQGSPSWTVSGASMEATQGGATMPKERILNWEAVERAKHKQEKRRSMPLSYDDFAGDEPHHEINRFAIAEIICRLCYTRQSSKT